MTTSRATTSYAVAALLALSALTACGSSGTGTGTTTPTPTPSTVAWAQGVCTSATDLKTSVEALGTSLSVDIGSGTSVLDQLKDQLGPQVDAVKTDVADLSSAIGAVPAGSDPSVQAAADQLAAARAALESSAAGIQTAAAGFQSASGLADRLTALKDVVSAAGAAKDDVAGLATALQGVAQSGSDAAKDAFAQAPACEPFRSS
jgi:hypothetical protein